MAMKLKYPIIYPGTIYKTTSLYTTETESRQLSFSIYRNIIEQHKKYLEEKYFYNDPQKTLEDLKKETFIDQVVYYENQLTKKQIDDHMLSIISPHRTLALQITQAVLMLAMHPDVQERVYQEIKECFSDEEIVLDYENVQKLEYMDRVIKETMRYVSLKLIVKTYI
jgi:cytochrome P450